VRKQQQQQLQLPPHQPVYQAPTYQWSPYPFSGSGGPSLRFPPPSLLRMRSKARVEVARSPGEALGTVEREANAVATRGARRPGEANMPSTETQVVSPVRDRLGGFASE
jgi:hypothetical protein